MTISVLPADGVRFDTKALHSELEAAMLSDAPWEPDFLALAEGKPLYAMANSGTILDIGANIGSSAVSFRKVGLTAPILCHEPNPFLADIIRGAADRIGKVAVSNMGFSDWSGELVLYVPFVDHQSLHQEASIFRDHFDQPFIRQRLQSYGTVLELAEVKVEIGTVDSLGLDVRFIKIDVEGAEAAVLRGARDTIERCRPVLHAENGALHETEELLTKLDYDWFYFGNGATCLNKSNLHYNRYWIPCEKLRAVSTMIGRP